jgi:hypothetical protein
MVVGPRAGQEFSEEINTTLRELGDFVSWGKTDFFDRLGVAYTHLGGTTGGLLACYDPNQLNKGRDAELTRLFTKAQELDISTGFLSREVVENPADSSRSSLLIVKSNTEPSNDGFGAPLVDWLYRHGNKPTDLRRIA